MSAQRLRDAAKVLRERAEAADILADREPWAVWPDLTEDGYVYVGNAGGVIPEGQISVDGEHNAVAKVYTPELADLIRTMHPGVALALADWLDDTATEVASGATYSQDALRLADLILGSQP